MMMSMSLMLWSCRWVLVVVCQGLLAGVGRRFTPSVVTKGLGPRSNLRNDYIFRL